MSEIKSKLGRNEFCQCGKRLLESAEDILGDHVTLYQNEPEIKMSELILDLVDDFLMTATTRSQLENIIMITCAAWNFAEIFPPEKHFEEIEPFIHEMLGDEVNHFYIQAFIQLMILRKTKKYPDVHLFIDDFELIGKPNDFHLNVVSSFRSEDGWVSTDLCTNANFHCNC